MVGQIIVIPHVVDVFIQRARPYPVTQAVFDGFYQRCFAGKRAQAQQFINDAVSAQGIFVYWHKTKLHQKE